MTDRDALREAIVNEGPHPTTHRMVMARHRREWPTLWRAIDTLLAQPAEPELDALLRENAIPLAKWLPSGKAGHLSDDDYRYLAETLRAALAPAEPGLTEAIAAHIACVCEALTGGDGPRPIGGGRVYHFQGCCADSDLALIALAEKLEAEE